MTSEIVYTHASGATLSFDCSPSITWDEASEIMKQEMLKGITNDPNKCLRLIKASTFITSSDIPALNTYMKPDVKIDYAATTAVDAAILDDGGVYTDDTTDANDAGANDVPICTNPPVANDAFYIGFTAQLTVIKINVGTASANGDETYVWEYYDGDSWESLEDLVDDTTDFTVTGSNFVSWTLPPDWSPTTINSQGPFYYIRIRIGAYSAGMTQNPLVTQMWQVGEYPYVAVVIDANTTWTFPCKMKSPTITKSNDSNYTISLTIVERTT
jgi:hypothetical protein